MSDTISPLLDWWNPTVRGMWQGSCQNHRSSAHSKGRRKPSTKGWKWV